MKEEIIDRIADGELLGWPGDVLEKLTNAESMSITEAAELCGNPAFTPIHLLPETMRGSMPRRARRT